MPIPHFYAVVSDKLLPTDQDWIGMKTVGRLRHEMGTKPELNKDSNYKVFLYCLQRKSNYIIFSQFNASHLFRLSCP